MFLALDFYDSVTAPLSGTPSMRQYLAEKHLGSLILRMSEKVIRRSLLDNLSVIHEDHTIRNRTSEAHLVGDADHGAALAGERDHRVQHFLDHFGIESRGRLVKEQGLGIHAERARSPHAAAVRRRAVPGTYNSVKREHGRRKSFRKRKRTLPLHYWPHSNEPTID